MAAITDSTGRIRTDEIACAQIKSAMRSSFTKEIAPGARVVKVGGGGGAGTVLTDPKGVGGNRGCMVAMDDGTKRWWPTFTLHPERSGRETTATDDARPWFV